MEVLHTVTVEDTKVKLQLWDYVNFHFHQKPTILTSVSVFSRFLSLVMNTELILSSRIIQFAYAHLLQTCLFSLVAL